MYEYSYDPELFKTHNKKLLANHDRFDHWYFFDNMRRSNINNIVAVEGFRFSAYELNDKQLTRAVFTSFLNYNIIVRISWGNVNNNELFKLIAAEAPIYFTIDVNATHDDFYIQWKDTNGIVQFGEDLISEKNLSKYATAWYNQTEEIIGSLYFE
jgi:hypothetical protein